MSTPGPHNQLEPHRPAGYGQVPAIGYGPARTFGWRQYEEILTLIIGIGRGMWRYRLHALAVATILCVLGWGFVYQMPDVYEANARVFVNTQSVLKGVVRDLIVAPDATDEINMLTRALVSRPKLEYVAQQTGLDRDVESPRQLEALLAGLGNRIQLRGERNSIFVISYRDTNPTTAANVVSVLLDSFVGDATGRQLTASHEASDFLEEQIKEYEQRLADAEKRLADFKQENVGLMPSETGDYYGRLNNAMGSLADTQSRLQLALERRAEFERQLVGEQPVFGFAPTPSSTPAAEVGGTGLDATIARYRSEMDNLLLRFTPKHPDVVALQQTIDRLEGERAMQRARAANVATPSVANPLDLNPVYQRLRIGLSETDVEIATLRTQLDAQQKVVDELKARVDTIPDIERQLAALNRDYRVTTAQYESLLQKRESVYMTGAVEESGNNIEFRTIEPAVVPLSPVAPNRSLYLAAVFIMAVGVAVVLAFLLDRLHPVVYSRRDVLEIADFPVYGTVNVRLSPAQKRQERLSVLTFSAACFGLVLAFGAALALSDHAVQLFQLLGSAGGAR